MSLEEIKKKYLTNLVNAFLWQPGRIIRLFLPAGAFAAKYMRQKTYPPHNLHSHKKTASRERRPWPGEGAGGHADQGANPGALIAMNSRAATRWR